MAISNLPDKTPLGACFRSPLKVLERRRKCQNILVFIILETETEYTNSVGQDNWDDDYALFRQFDPSNCAMHLALANVDPKDVMPDGESLPYNVGYTKCSATPTLNELKDAWNKAIAPLDSVVALYRNTVQVESFPWPWPQSIIDFDTWIYANFSPISSGSGPNRWLYDMYSYMNTYEIL